jgi:alanine dehydrogenase
MKPGSVIVDVAIDQGGCIETSRPTTHSEPVYLVDGVVHYCVANIPGAVGRTSTFALCNVTLPWAARIAERGILEAAKHWQPVASAINTYRGELTTRQLAEAFDMPWSAFAA